MMNRYSHPAFDRFFHLPLFQFATQVVDPGTGGGGALSGGGGSGSGSPGAGGGAPSGGSGQPGASGAPAAINWDTAPQQFRDGYNKLKADFEQLTKDHEPWQNWSKESGVTHDQLGNVHSTYQAVYGAIDGIAEQLGYTVDEVDAAIAKHGVIKTLNWLQNASAQGGDQGRGDGQDDLNTQIQDAVSRALGPIEQRENERLTEAGNQRFEQIVRQSMTEAFKAEGVDVTNIPKEESFMLMSAASEILKYDEAALVALKKGQGQAQVQKAFQQAKTFLDQYYLSRSTRERTKIQGAGGGNQGRQQSQNQGGKKPTLDEMIEEPTLINQKYKVGT